MIGPGPGTSVPGPEVRPVFLAEVSARSPGRVPGPLLLPRSSVLRSRSSLTTVVFLPGRVVIFQPGGVVVVAGCWEPPPSHDVLPSGHRLPSVSVLQPRGLETADEELLGPSRHVLGANSRECKTSVASWTCL